MKFNVLVEGHTENKALGAFLKRWLDSRLTPRVGVKTVRLEGWKELKKDAPIKVDLLGREGDVIAVIGLLDLYGPEFPAHLTDIKGRCEWLISEMERRVDQPKFRQFVAVHEIEAWLLSDVGIFDRSLQGALQKVTDKPETVDFEEPPKKLLSRLYREKLKRKYRPRVDSVNLLEKLDPERAYQKCPHFRSLLDTMLELAKNAIAG